MDEKQKWLDAVFEATRAVKGVPIYGRFGDGKWCYTQAPLSWKPAGARGDGGPAVDVPVGFVTDLASIPSPFWSYLPPFGKYMPAAIIHDHLYWEQPVSRETADRIFDDAMKSLNTREDHRRLIITAVQAAGGSAWKGNARAKAAGEKRVLVKFPDDATITWEDWKRQPDVFH